MTSILLALLLTQAPAKTKVVATESGTGKAVEVGDSTNKAVRVNCVSGCSAGGGTASSVSLSDGTTATQKASVSAGGALKVDGSAVTQPVSGTVTISSFPSVQAVSGTFWQTTQPVSGPLTDTQLRASVVPTSDNHTTAAAPISVRLTDGSAFYSATGGAGGSLATAAKGTTTAGSPTSTAVDANTQALHTSVTNFPATQAVSGTFWQATQPVSGPLTDTQLRATAVPVSGTFFQATQPVSGTVTANQGTANTAANAWFVKPSTNTGSATPGQAMLAGGGAVSRGSAPNGTVAGNLSMLTTDPDSRLYVDTNHPNLWNCKVDAATVTTQCQAAPAASTFLNVADVVLTNGATAQTVQLIYGTGTNCATGPVAVSPAINMAVNSTVTINFTQTVKVPVAANALCCKPSGSTAFGCWVSGYTSAN